MSTPLRLLLIEDSERDAALLQLYLRRAGWQTTLVRIETEAELRERLGAEAWDLIVSDVNLPHFGAKFALDVLRELGVNIPLFALSGETNEKIIEELLASGARKYFVKDQTAALVAAIDEVLPRSV